MMKKKMKNYGDVKHNDISKSTEIKENTTDQDKLYKQESDNSGSVGSVESAFDGSEGGATSSDKVVLEVKEGEEKLAEMQDKYIRLSAEFERALKHLDTTGDCVVLKERIEIIYGKFSDFLKQNGIKEIESLNCSFNVDLHDAVSKVPVEEADKKGKVVDVLLKGYYLQDKVLRHSKVVVGD